LHHALQQAASFQQGWADALQHVTLPDFDSFKTNPRSFETMDDLCKFRVDCESALAALAAAVSSDLDAIDSGRLKRKGRKAINGINEIQQFPTYDYILDNLNKALEKPSPEWGHSQ
jgi:hypothetical protein